MKNCESNQQMEKYFEIARNFDKTFTGNGLIPNCLRYSYVPHDYFSDLLSKKLDNVNESSISVAFTSFYKKVSI